MVLELIKSAAFLLALSLLQGFIVRFLCPRNRLLAQVASGIVFGGICVVGMMMPIEVVPGVIFDPRSVILSMAGLFGGPAPAAIAMVIAGGYRAWLGGGGATVGIAVIFVSTLLGLAYRYGHRKGWVEVDVPALLVFGLIVHVIEVVLFTQLPAVATSKVMERVALPLLLIFTPATAILGLLLKDLEQRLQTESDLRSSETRLSLHLQNTPLAAVTWDRDFRCVQWNRAAEQIFGYSQAEAIGRHASELIVPERLKPQLQAVFQDLLTGNGGERGSNENVTKNGQSIFCDWYNTPIVNELGETVGVVSLAEDVTELKRTTEELQFKNLLLLTQQEASVDGILSVDTEGRIISVNRRFFELWGLPESVNASGLDRPLLDKALEEVADPESFLLRINYLNKHREEVGNDEVVLRNGRVLERQSAPMTGPDGEYFGRLWMFRDITERKKSEELIWQQANFDGLTGLANRQMLYDRLEQAIKAAHRGGGHVALLFLDLDHFKDVNDTLGHDIGDRLLMEAAKRLGRCVREADTVARQGGDEFIIVMGELIDTAHVERVAEDILHNLAQPFRLGEETAYVSTSIGITFYPDDAASVDDLLKNADQAMYAAKDRGRNCYQYFTAAMQEQAVSRMSLVKDLRQAMPPGNQFLSYYQPIIDLASGDVIKAEALIRWQHPVRGLVGPDQFIPVAEDTRMINDIGDWVFQQAVSQLRRWRDLLHPNFQISINASPIQFRSENSTLNDWIAYLRDSGLGGEAIVVEITEGILMEATPNVTEKLFAFRDAGVQVSLDDFGTGYSSLAYLKKFHIDYLKIDQSFVRGLAPGSDDMTLCESIIVMAHKLGIKVIAEGVETLQQRDLLAAAGCDYAQGYYFSRPVTADEFEKLVAG